MATDPALSEAFALSRLYAMGWAAGAEHGGADDLTALIDTLNPGTTDAERLRWAQGFTEAAQRSQDRKRPRKAPARTGSQPARGTS